MANSVNVENIVTIQKTSRHIKKDMMWAGITCWGSVGLWYLFPTHWRTWLFLIALSLLWYAQLKAQAWWENG